MHRQVNFVFFLVALIATASQAIIFPRQVTSTSTTSESSTIVRIDIPVAPPASTSAPSSPAVSLSATSTQPFLSVENGGSLVTVTPTNTSPGPMNTAFGNSTSVSNSSVIGAPACTPSNYALDGSAAPFCLPANGTAWIKNTNNPVTWDPNFWPQYTGNVIIALLYTGKDGSNVITQNGTIANQQGYINIDVDANWLNGNEVVAAQLLIAPNEVPSSNGGAHYGPIVTLQVSETPFDNSPPKFNSKSLAVVIAIPVSVFAFILFSCGVCLYTRNQRKFPKDLYVARSGRKWKKGYAEGRSRRARTGLKKTTDEFEMGAVGGYRDEPTEVYADIPEHVVPDSSNE